MIITLGYIYTHGNKDLKSTHYVHYAQISLTEPLAMSTYSYHVILINCI